MKLLLLPVPRSSRRIQLFLKMLATHLEALKVKGRLDGHVGCQSCQRGGGSTIYKITFECIILIKDRLVGGGGGMAFMNELASRNKGKVTATHATKDQDNSSSNTSTSSLGEDR